MKNMKKVLAVVLSVMLLISVMPFAAFATGATIDVADQNELTTAFANAQNGDTIRFTASNSAYPGTSGAKVYDINGKDITLDLNGQTQYFRVSGETAVVYQTVLFYIHNGAKLTVVDSVGGGAIYATYSANSAAYVFQVNDTSELVINSGSIVLDNANYGATAVITKGSATATINGGEFTAVGSTRRNYLVRANNDSAVEINGGTFNAAKASDYVVDAYSSVPIEINDGSFNGSISGTANQVVVNGGTFLQTDGETANGAVAKYLPTDKVIDANGQIADVAATTVAKIDSAEYETLADAIAAVGEGVTATITLLKDCTLAGTTTIEDNQKITINMNGHDITCAARVFNIRHGQLTLDGEGTLNSDASAAVAVYGATTSTSSYSVFTLNKNVTIEAPNGYGAMIGANGNASYGAKLQINGTINSKYGLYINGNVAEPDVKTNAATININGTVNASSENAAIYAAGYAKWNLNSTAVINGGTGVYIKSGNLTVNGATINATGAKTAYAFNPNGADGTGDGIAIDSCGYPGNVPTVTIKAGNISSANGDAVASYTKQDDPLYPDAEFERVDEVIPATSTAVFSSDVSALAADGYKTSYDATAGGYVVIEADAVAEVNGVRYASFEEALAAISNVSTAKHSKAVDPNYDYKTYVANGTIKLLADTTSNGIIIGSGSNLVVDFNGHTLDINAKPVGSNGTESAAMQLLKDSDITFKNGTLTSSYTYSGTDTEYIQRLIQNYSNLTLDNMNVTMTGNFMNAITISTCNGDFVVKDSTVSAPDFSALGYTTAMAAEQLGAEAFAFGTFSSYTAATATVQGDSTINGNVSVGVTNPDVSTNTLTLTGGTLNGDIVMKDNADSEGVEITKANTFTQEAPEGYKWVDNGDGTSTIAEVNYVAQIGSTKYETLEEAFAAAQDGNTITVLADCSGNGIKVPQGKFATGLTVDFGGHTYTVNGTTVGSTGTETQGFQLLKNNNITFQNGKIYGSSRETSTLQFLIQNYSNLTLDNMELELIGQYYNQYTLSNNNGNIVINDSIINAADYSWAGLDASDVNSFAFDVCRYSSYPSVSVTVTGNSVINGDVEVSASNNDAKNGLELNLVSGTMSGDIVLADSAKALINAEDTNATVQKAAGFSKEAPEGFEWDEDGILVPVVEPVNGGSLTLTDGIAFNAYLDADAYGVDASEAVVKLTYNAKSDINDRQTQVITETKALSSVEKYVDETSPYNGTYKFVFSQAPAQMNEDIVIELYANADETGPVASITTSAAELCETVIATSNDAEYVALCKSLLDYGRAAQIYFEYDLANVAAAYNNDAVTTLGYADMRTTAASLSGIPFKGVSLTALSTTKWNILVTEAQTIDTVTGAATSATSEVLFGDNNAIVVNGVNAADFAKTFTVYTGSGSVTLSAAMIARAIVKASTDSQYQDLARAFYLYGCQAESFFAA